MFISTFLGKWLHFKSSVLMPSFILVAPMHATTRHGHGDEKICVKEGLRWDRNKYHSSHWFLY